MTGPQTSSMRWPWLMSWLPAAGGWHLFRPGDYEWPVDVYDRLEELVASVEALNPVGLFRKRAAFRKGRADALMNLRSELLTAQLLAGGGIALACPDFPDFVCSKAFTGGVEVTSRTKNDMDWLNMRLRGLPNPGGLEVETVGGRPVLPGSLLDGVVAEAGTLLRRGEGGNVERPELDLRVMIGRAVDASVSIDEVLASWRGQVGACVAELPAIIDRKTAQANRARGPLPRPLVLLVDMSGFADLGAGVGPLFFEGTLRELSARLGGLDLEVFDALVVGISNLRTNRFTGVVHRREGLGEGESRQLAVAEGALLGDPQGASGPGAARALMTERLRQKGLA